MIQRYNYNSWLNKWWLQQSLHVVLILLRYRNPLDKDFNYDDIEVFPEYNSDQNKPMSSVQQQQQQQNHHHQQQQQQNHHQQQQQQRYNPPMYTSTPIPKTYEENVKSIEDVGFMNEFAQDGFFDTQKLSVGQNERIKKDSNEKEYKENAF